MIRNGCSSTTLPPKTDKDFLIVKHLAKCVTGSKFITNRISDLQWQSKTCSNNCICIATLEDKDNFYESLQTHTSNNIKRHDIHLVLGDFNARQGYYSQKEAPMTVGSKTSNNG